MSSSNNQGRPQKMAIDLATEDYIRHLERVRKKGDVTGRRSCITQVWR